MTKKEMIILVAKKFGLECEYTIEFAEAAEWMGLAELEMLFQETLSLPIFSEEDLD